MPLPPHPIDGKDIWPLLTGERVARAADDAFFFWYHDGDLEAMRMGRWKLHFPHAYRTLHGREPGRDGRPGQYAPARVGPALYDVVADPAERFDLAATMPAVAAQLARRAHAARADLGDRLTGKVGSGVRAPGRMR